MCEIYMEFPLIFKKKHIKSFMEGREGKRKFETLSKTAKGQF